MSRVNAQGHLEFTDKESGAGTYIQNAHTYMYMGTQPTIGSSKMGVDAYSG